jgi:hypothetical protein
VLGIDKIFHSYQRNIKASIVTKKDFRIRTRREEKKSFTKATELVLKVNLRLMKTLQG